MTKSTIYLVGIFALGLTQDWLRNSVGNFVFLPIILFYLLALVAMAEKFGKREK